MTYKIWKLRGKASLNDKSNTEYIAKVFHKSFCKSAISYILRSKILDDLLIEAFFSILYWSNTITIDNKKILNHLVYMYFYIIYKHIVFIEISKFYIVSLPTFQKQLLTLFCTVPYRKTTLWVFVYKTRPS